MLPYRATRRSADNSRSLLCNDAYGFRDVMVMPRLFDLPALQKTCGQRWGWTADKTLSVAQELYDGDGKKLITYPRAEAGYLTENQISDVPAIVAALTRLRGFAQLEIAPPVIRRGKSGHFCGKALEGISHHAVIPNISQGSTGLHGNGPRAGTNSDEDAFAINDTLAGRAELEPRGRLTEPHLVTRRATRLTSRPFRISGSKRRGRAPCLLSLLN